ncbi:TrkA C-terminal domain-containing protein [Haloarculaceae archaeon H-GB1-1]|nr:TrkA C-terminal domain-containing protein [Haloarculaceae archaeon H-GB1-1]
MTVYETDIPGVGRKFELELDGEARAIVVVHHDGRRELFHRATPDADSEKLFDLDGEQARQLGSILSGAYFESVATDDLTLPLGEAFIEWFDVESDSPLVGETLESAAIRAETGVSVIAVQRGTETLENPDAGFELQTDDVLVTLGTRDEQTAVEDLLHADD